MSDKEIKKNKVFLVTYGCQMNVRDSEVVCGLLKKAGYAIAAGPEKADVLIFNTCSVRQHAEEKVWSEVGRFAKKRDCFVAGAPRNDKTSALHNDRPIIGIVGCMAQNYKEAIFQRVPEVDFVVGPQDIDKIPEIVGRLAGRGQSPVTGKRSGDSPLFQRKIWETEGGARPEEIYHSGFYADKKHVYVVISEGCSNFCSYCVVPYVRGPLRNRDHREILREIEEAVDKGIKSITLLGQNVNAYSTDCRLQTKDHRLKAEKKKENVTFVKLLELVNEIKGLKEFSFITSHPKDTTVDLFRAMAGLEKLKKYLHLPVQSGSDKILELMNRGYTRKYYLDLADNYRKIVKGGVLTSDIIVGFPGETETDFQDTYDLVKTACFNAGFIFKYSPRPHTAAEKLPDDVPREIKEERHQKILNLQKEISNKKYDKKED